MQSHVLELVEVFSVHAPSRGENRDQGGSAADGGSPLAHSPLVPVPALLHGCQRQRIRRPCGPHNASTDQFGTVVPSGVGSASLAACSKLMWATEAEASHAALKSST